MKFTGERLVLGEKSCKPKTIMYKEHMARYKFAVDFINKNDIVLDLACGTGYGSRYLTQYSNSSQVLGVDNDYYSIEYANTFYKNNRSVFRQMDVTNLSLNDSSVDVIVSFETIEHVSDYKQMIKEMSHVLKKSGLLVISTPNRELSNNDNEFHCHEFMYDELINELSPYFSDFIHYGQRKYETFGKMITLLHQRWLVKLLRSDKYLNVIKKDLILSNELQNIVLVCKNNK